MLLLFMGRLHYAMQPCDIQYMTNGTTFYTVLPSWEDPAESLNYRTIESHSIIGSLRAP